MKIDKGIPIPETTAAGRPIKYPWDELKKGDSFFAPETKLRSMQQSVSRCNRLKKPRHFVCREVSGGTRVWRDE